MKRSGIAVGFALASFAGGTNETRAEERPKPDFGAHQCTTAFAREVARRLDDELPEPRGAKIEIVCDQDAVTARVFGSHGDATRNLSLASVPTKSRARLVALAVAELALETTNSTPTNETADDAASAVDAEPESILPKSPAAAPALAPSFDAAVSSRKGDRIIGVSVSGSALAGDFLLFGLGVQRQITLAPNLAIVGGLEIERGSSKLLRHFENASVTVLSGSGSVGAAALARTSRNVELQLRAGFRAGAAELSGTSENRRVAWTDDVFGGFIAPTVGGAIRSGIESRVGTTALIEGGWVTAGPVGRVYAEQVGFRGPYLKIASVIEF